MITIAVFIELAQKQIQKPMLRNSMPEIIISEITVSMIETFGIQKPMLRNSVPGIIISKIIVFMTETLEIQIDLNLEHIMSNNIIVYDISKMIIQIISIIDEFS